MLAVLFSTPLGAALTLLGAAALPVLIHLFTRRRFQVVEWAAMRFLLAARRQSARRLKLEQWLLLATRCLILVLAAAAMASVAPWAEDIWRQVLPGGPREPAPSAGRTHKILVIDGTLSMSLQADEGTLFDIAKKQAVELVCSSSSGDGFSVVVLGTKATAIVPGPADDSSRVVAEIESQRGSHGAGELTAALNLVEELAKRSSGRFAQREVYFFTDLQRATWALPASPAGSWRESWSRLQTLGQVAVVDVGRDAADNLAVTSLSLGDPLAIRGMRTHVTATIANFGSSARTDVRCELRAAFGGTSPVVVRQETVAVPAWGSATVTFPFEYDSAGDLVLQVRVVGDPLTADDVRSLTVSVRDMLPVLLVNGRPAADRREQAASWLSDALDPFSPGDRRPAYPARPRTIDFDQFADPVQGDLSSCDVVFLCNVPRLPERVLERLDVHLQRGGGVVFGLGPEIDLEHYNRRLFGDGQYILPGRLSGIVRATGDRHFVPTAVGEVFTVPPLAAFVSDDDRAALLNAQFRQYVRIQPSGRVILSLDGGDPLVVERARHRGKVVLFASTWNTEWNNWPTIPGFPPFVQEILRFAAPSGPRRTITAGDAFDELLAANVAGGEASVILPDGRNAVAELRAESLFTRLEFGETDLSGLYRILHGSPRRDLTLAVNVPVGGTGGAESDLRRIRPDELQSLTPDDEVQVVRQWSEARRGAKSTSAEPGPAPPPVVAVRGQAIARVSMLVVFCLLVLEVILAWRFSSARSATANSDEAVCSPRTRWLDAAFRLAVFGLVAACFAVGAVLFHAAWTDDFLAFLPPNAKSSLESFFGVPAAESGEGTRWRLQFTAFLTGRPATDRWLAGIAGIVATVLAIVILRRETRRGLAWPLAALRPLVFAMVLTLFLPQLRLIFERQGWPDLVVMIDDSRSMSHTDNEPKSTVQPQPSASRLALVQSLLTRNDGEWFEAMKTGRQTRVHVYRFSEQAERIGDPETPAGDAIRALKPNGTSSRLGRAVHNVLQEFRGASLAGIVLFSDGIDTTAGDLTAAAREAALAGVPIYPVGVGDAQEPRDLILHDLQVDDSIHVQDRLFFDAKLTVRGTLRATSATVSLMEKVGEEWKELRRETVALEPGGKPARVRLSHVPSQSGERKYALVVPVAPEESDPTNNRLERSVFVAEAQRTRVLYIEGYPRYEYRFLKSLLERETNEVRGNKSIELKTLLLDADADHARQDRSAIESLPANRDELFRQFDLIILGDVDPRHARLGEKHLQWIADFVATRGGGLLVIAGPQFTPQALRDTPLAGFLPLELPPRPGNEEGDQSTPFRMRLTALGQPHPIFRLAPDDAANSAIWDRLMPLYWSVEPLKPKPAAEVLAVRPDENGRAQVPIALQHFVGAGRVLFLGFDESWRWRRQNDEKLYNQFWLQAIRFVARTRLGRCELRLDRQTAYRQGEPIRVTVRLPDDAPPPGPDAKVQVDVESVSPAGDVETQTLALSRVEGNRGTFDAIVLRVTEGVWKFRLAAPVQSGGTPHAEARVLPPPGEMDRLGMDRPEMERAATISHGRYWPLADAGRLPQDLPELSRVTLHQPRPPLGLWNHPIALGMLAALAASEWILRKRRHLL